MIVTISFKNEHGECIAFMTQQEVAEMVKKSPAFSCLFTDAKTGENKILGLKIFDALGFAFPEKMSPKQFLKDQLGWGEEFVHSDFLKNIPPEIETIINRIIDKTPKQELNKKENS